MEITEILDSTASEEAIIAALKEKAINVPSWGGAKGLQREYDPRKHPVMSKAEYPDIVENGRIEYQTRITYDLQRLAVRRMTELCTGTPVKRIYSPQNDRQAEIAKYIENILTRNRIDTLNNERCSKLYASCEVITLWYAVEQPTNIYGFESPFKLRCSTYSPMQGDELYPLFDEYGDMIALSIGYRRKVGKRWVQYFDAYTADRHVKWSNESGSSFARVEDEQTTIGKIPAIYMWRPTPIWEDTSKIVFEMEWAMSRNGNYLRRNSKPIFAVFGNTEVQYGREGNAQEGRAILQFPEGSRADYITWAQAVDNLKFYISELRQMFFTQLQLPDWSYESMKSAPMSGESRKQLFIDAMLKVRDESGRLVEAFDREVNVIKAFLKTALPVAYHADIDALPVENEIRPYTITEEKDTIANLMTANGGKALITQRESVEALGWSADVEKTMAELQAQENRDAFEPYA